MHRSPGRIRIENSAKRGDNPFEFEINYILLVSRPSNPEAVRTPQDRLAQIERLLTSDPALADRQALEFLAGTPDHPMALLFHAIASRLNGNPALAIEILETLCRSWPEAALPHLQLGLALRETGQNETAVQSIRRAVAVKPDFSDAWLALADMLTALVDKDGADAAFGKYIRYSGSDPHLTEAATAIRENRSAEAEVLLRRRLRRHPADIVALCMLAKIAVRYDQTLDAETLLVRCLELAPGYRSARHDYAELLIRQNRLSEALAECNRLLADDAENPGVGVLRASLQLRQGNYDEAMVTYNDFFKRYPGQPNVWVNLGNVLRMVGRHDQCTAAYRKAITLAPDYGEAYWNLANLKTFEIKESELESMRAQIHKPGLRDEDRIHFQFAMGKALEDRGEFADSFQCYAEGNRLRRRSIRYEAMDFSKYIHRCKALFNATFFAERTACGTSAADPIFIVGLPRAGSTLVEQILASHSAVEGTMELPDIADIANLATRGVAGPDRTTYPEALAGMHESEFRELGESYVERTRCQRQRNTPFFIDKTPNNFAHVGLIHLILPNARIIDIRRHPMACGLSLYTQLFARGQNFSYSLEDIGRYYRGYVELMAHFDTVLPGRVHRVIYEELIQDTEAEVRRLLEHCGLHFEEACLNFHENKRAVSTPSSEQVRTPIFRNAIEHWRHYESWLGPLKAAVGSVVDAYPGIPKDFDTAATEAASRD